MDIGQGLNFIHSINFSSFSVAIIVNINPVVYNVSENQGSAIVSLQASSAASSTYSVTVTTQDGTAIGK